MWVDYIFFATRIRINVSWSGTGSGPMIRIRNIDINYETVYSKPSFFSPYSLYSSLHNSLPLSCVRIQYNDKPINQ